MWILFLSYYCTCATMFTRTRTDRTITTDNYYVFFIFIFIFLIERKRLFKLYLLIPTITRCRCTSVKQYLNSRCEDAVPLTRFIPSLRVNCPGQSVDTAGTVTGNTPVTIRVKNKYSDDPGKNVRQQLSKLFN